MEEDIVRILHDMNEYGRLLVTTSKNLTATVAQLARLAGRVEALERIHGLHYQPWQFGKN